MKCKKLLLSLPGEPGESDSPLLYGWLKTALRWPLPTKLISKLLKTRNAALKVFCLTGSACLCSGAMAAMRRLVAAHHHTIRAELGPVGVLVNNAGIMTARNFEQISIQDWDETIRVNLNSAFYWSRQVVADMKAMQFGRIINISSLAARGGGVVGPHYAASKAGILGLTRYAAKELGPHGITVNAIAPAFIEDAGIFADWPDRQESRPEAKDFCLPAGQCRRCGPGVRLPDGIAFCHRRDAGCQRGGLYDLIDPSRTIHPNVANLFISSFGG